MKYIISQYKKGVQRLFSKIEWGAVINTAPLRTAAIKNTSSG